MRIRTAALLAATLLATGCYNNPDISDRQPGQGDKYIVRGPSVGPGTTPGGATAGPQPKARPEGEHSVEPTHSGATTDQVPGPEHAGASQPNAGHATAVPEGSPAETGTEPRPTVK